MKKRLIIINALMFLMTSCFIGVFALFLKESQSVLLICIVGSILLLICMLMLITYSMLKSFVDLSQQNLEDISHSRELDQLRDNFLRTISHELRTPLTSIIGFLDLVRKGTKPGAHKKYLEIAYDEAMDLKVLIDDLLDLSKIESGKMKLEYSEMNVKSFLDHLVLSLCAIAKAKEIFLVTEFDDEHATIFADNAKLRRVMYNLIANGLKYTKSGGVTLNCQFDNNCAIFSVRDTGIGLQEGEKEYIFERFRQITNSLTSKHEGVGLGLSIVKQLVEMHRGKIWVESKYGNGAKFYFSIPLGCQDFKVVKQNKKQIMVEGVGFEPT